MVTIASALLVLAFRSGAIVEGFKNLTKTLENHQSRIDTQETKLAEHAARIAVLESDDKRAANHAQR